MVNIPTDNNNPGDIKDVSGHFKTMTNPAQGQAALYNDLTSKMTGHSSHGLTPDSSLVDFAKVYDGSPNEKDNLQYAATLANKMGISPDTKIGTLLPHIDQFARAVADAEGYKGEWKGSFDTKIPQAGIGQLPSAATAGQATPQNAPGVGNLPGAATSPGANTNPGYTGTVPNQPQGHGAAGLLTGLANVTGMQSFGAGLSTLDPTVQNTVSHIGEQEGQGQQSVIDAIHKQTDPTKKQQLISFLKNQYGVNYTPSASELNPAYNLKNSDVLKSAGATALGALSGGSLPQEGMVSGEIARDAAVKGSTPLLGKLAESGYEGSKGLLTKLIPTTKVGKVLAAVAADAVGHQVAKTKIGAAIVKNVPLLKLLFESGG